MGASLLALAKSNIYYCRLAETVKPLTLIWKYSDCTVPSIPEACAFYPWACLFVFSLTRKVLEIWLSLSFKVYNLATLVDEEKNVFAGYKNHSAVPYYDSSLRDSRTNFLENYS